MRRLLYVLVVTAPVFFSLQSHAEAPRRIAGFILGTNISQYQDKVRMDTAMPIRHMEYLSEVETAKIEGYKNGYISYGTCAQPGRIVKVKFKYEIPDKWFFEELLKRFESKFGKPSEWKGDPFHTLIAWKWSLKDSQKNVVSMILQHYSGEDEEYTRGNSLRLTIRKFLEEERECYEKKFPEPPDTAGPPGKWRAEDKKRIDYNRFVPE